MSVDGSTELASGVGGGSSAVAETPQAPAPITPEVQSTVLPTVTTGSPEFNAPAHQDDMSPPSYTPPSEGSTSSIGGTVTAEGVQPVQIQQEAGPLPTTGKSLLSRLNPLNLFRRS